MKNLKFVLFLAFFFISAQTVFSQRSFVGRVIEVVDGKTIVAEVQSRGKITVILQFIEIPEPDQPLYQNVKEHLEKLVIEREVLISPNGFNKLNTVGKVEVGDVDVGMQMIRDGAAWHADLEKGGQDARERAVYEDNQVQAKNEKRGIWSVEGLRPAWEVRAEKRKAEAMRQKEALEAQIAENKKKREQKAARNTNNSQNGGKLLIETWGGGASFGMSDALVRISESTGDITLSYAYYPHRDESWISTPVLLSDVKSGNDSFEIFYGFGYVSKGEKLIKGGNLFTFAIVPNVTNYYFVQKNNIVIYLDGGKTLNFGKINKIVKTEDGRNIPLGEYRISRKNLQAIVNSKKVVLAIGKYKRTLEKPVINVLSKLLSEI